MNGTKRLPSNSRLRSCLLFGAASTWWTEIILVQDATRERIVALVSMDFVCAVVIMRVHMLWSPKEIICGERRAGSPGVSHIRAHVPRYLHRMSLAIDSAASPR